THVVALNGMATPVAGITTDIDGETRNVTTPDIGADEFSPVMPLSGPYTVGTPGGVYGTIAAAVADLMSRGVAGPVTFQLLTGTFTQQRIAIIGVPPGASAVNRVRFISLSNDSTQVTVQSDASLSDGSDAVVTLTGTKYVSVEKMTLMATGASSSNGAVVWLAGSSTDDKVLDCVLGETVAGTRSGVFAAIGAAVDRLELRRNRLTGFSYGLQLYNLSAAGAVVDANRITSNGSAVFLGYVSGAVVVSNNFIVAQGGNTAVTANYNSDLTLAYNSVNATGGGYGLNAALTGGALTVKNNIVANLGGGNAYNVSISGGTVVNDYNDVTSTGAVLAYWNGAPVADLAALKAASGQEAHSVSFSPGYASATDLHTHVVALNGMATPVAGITTDIDGETRNVTTPDIGADEFSPVMPLSGPYTVGTPGGVYGTIAAAVADLMSRGVAGPVTFQLLTGTFTQQRIAIIGVPPGASAVNRVRFISLSNDSTQVTVQSDASLSDGSDAVVTLTGTKYVSVEKMTLMATGASSSNGAVVWLAGSSTDDKVLDCVLGETVAGTRSGVFAAIGAAVDRLELRRNRLTGFSYGLQLYNLSAAGAVVDANKFTSSGNDIYLGYVTGPMMVSNNFVIAQGAGAAISAAYNSDLTLAFNSVNASGGGYGLNAGLTGGALTVKNNIVANLGGGNAYNVSISGGTVVN